MYPFNYQLSLYRRNNFGQPCVWIATPFDYTSIEVYHGIVGKTITRDIIHTHRKPEDEVKSRIAAKRKAGYKLLSELKDNTTLPVEGELLSYLSTYLPAYRTTADGSLLPMLAKVYDNVNNKLFNKVPYYIGQWKINGLRCFITAYVNSGNMFKPIGLKFQSREGTYWNSLSYLEDYLLSVLDNKLLERMVDENYILDGEVYLPGHTVNEINHFVKDPNDIHNKLLQFWCYDIAIPEMVQHKRDRIRLDIKQFSVFDSKDKHLNNKKQLVILPTYYICNDADAHAWRDKFIDLGFEGLILRNPDVDYQYGRRRVGYMEKFKTKTDGKFEIVDIQPERKRNLPIITCRNDINDSTFETRFSLPHDKQEYILNHKEDYIGKFVFISYGERSGVERVPFHIKEVSLI